MARSLRRLVLTDARSSRRFSAPEPFTRGVTTLTEVALREPWLANAIEAIVPLFSANDLQVPPVRISVGFPGGRNKSSKTIGQCWAGRATADDVAQIFIH